MKTARDTAMEVVYWMVAASKVSRPTMRPYTLEMEVISDTR